MKRNKFGAIRTEVDGVKFHSKREAARYVELKTLQKAGKIEYLRLQPKFDITIKRKKIFSYFADFSYRDTSTGAMIYEDVKGRRTDVYRIKKKAVEAEYGIVIKET